MSKKKLEVDETKVDRELDYDDFDMDFPDMSEDRVPISKPGKAFAKGVKRGISDSDLIGSMIRKNIPKEYGETYDMLKEVSKGTKDFAKDAVKQAKPIIGDLANAAEKFLPSNFKATKERLSKIRDWSQNEEGTQAGPNKEDIRKASVGLELGRIFQEQQKVDQINEKINKREKALDRGINIGQHRDILSVLTKLTNSNERLAGYTTTVNSAWQKKTLETQFHTLFVLQDLLTETKTTNAQVISSLEAITKNSALPEYVKTNRDEAFMAEARSKFSGKIIESSGRFFEKGLKKMRTDVAALVSDIGSISSMVSMAGDLNAMSEEMDPTTLTDRASGMVGTAAGKWLVAKGGGRLLKMAKKNPNVVKGLAQGQNFLKSFQDDGEGLFKEYLKKKQDSGDEGMLATLAGYLNKTFEREGTKVGLEKFDARKMYNASPFTNKVAFSITDVIPGYLSRILQEQTMVRTGKKADLLKFDYTSGKFANSKKISAGIAESISSKKLSTVSDLYFKDIFASIEETVELSEKERSSIANAFLKKSVDNTSLNPEKMTSEDHWLELLGNEATAKKMAEAMKEIYGTESDKEFYSLRGMDPQKKSQANKFIERVKDVKHVRKDFHSRAQMLVDAGLEDEAVKGGLIDKNGNLNISLIDRNSTVLKNSFKGKGTDVTDILSDIANGETDYAGQDETILESIYKRARKAFEERSGQTDPDDGIGTSDEDVKDNIKKPGSVLESISRLPIMSWKYKKGVEDSGATTNIGPMAQDMQKEFGDEVAPGGKKIDLVNASGIAMKAIQELNSKLGKTKKAVSGLFGAGEESEESEKPKSSYLPSNGLECLRGIYANTASLVNQGSAMINISAEGIKNMALGLGVQLGKIDLSGVAKSVQDNYKSAADFVKSNRASSILGKIGDFITDKGGSILGSGFDNAEKIGKGVYKQAKKTGAYIAEKSRAMFDEKNLAIQEAFDVYVAGESEPRITLHKLKRGAYSNFVTGEAVRYKKDVRLSVGGVAETMQDGSMEIVLAGSELDKAVFVNAYKSVLEKVLIGAKDKILGAGKSVFNNILSPSWRGARAMLSSGKNSFLKLADQPVDLYVVDSPERPVLLAKDMRDGFLVDHASGETIERPSQIKGAVFHTVRKEIALSVDEFRKGLVDVYGKKVDSPVLKIAGKAIGTAVGVGMTTMRWTMNKLASAPGMLGRMADKGSKAISNLASKIGVPGLSFGGFGKQSNDLLTQIRDILSYQAGLSSAPSGVQTGLVSSSSETIEETVNPNKERPEQERTSTNEPVVNHGSNVFSIVGKTGLAALNMATGKRGQEAANDSTAGPEQESKVESKLSKLTKALNSISQKVKDPKSAAKDLAEKASTKVKGGIQKTKDGLRIGSWQEREQNKKNVNDPVERDKAEVRTYATKNIFAMIASVVGGIKKKVGDWMGKKGDPESLAEDIADNAGGPDRESRRRRGGRRSGRGIKGNLLKYGGKALGAAGVAYGAYSTYDNIKEGNYGEAALDAGLTAAGAVATVGGLGAVGSTLGAIGGGALAVGGTALSLLGTGLLATGGAALSVLGSPITLAAIGLAGAAYGGYKAYKYLTRKEFNYTEKVRMLEYGLRGGNDAQMRTIFELETYLESVSKTTKEEFVIDAKKVDLKKLYSIFEINEKDQARVNEFQVWLEHRFKPVFGKWKLIVKAVGDSDKIEWLEKAPMSKLLEVYKAFKMSAEVFSVKNSPFQSIKLNTDLSVLENFRSEWLLQMKDDAVKDKDFGTAKAVSATGLDLVASRKAGEASSAPNAQTGVNALGSSNPNSTKNSVTLSSQFVGNYIEGTVTALDAVKWRAYGLVSLKASSISALKSLEALVLDNTKIDSSGKATFDGDVSVILSKAGSYFGVPAQSKHADEWTRWFTNRFLPVYLGLHSSLFAITKRTDLKENLRFVEKAKASQLLMVARAVIGASGVWAVKEGAFTGEPSSTDAKACEANMAFLSSQASEEKLVEQKLGAAPAQKPVSPVVHKAPVNTNAFESPVNKAAPAVAYKQSTAQAIGVDDDVEDKSYADMASGGKPASKTISSGAVSSIAGASGELLSGSGGAAHIKLAKNANINGLHPSIKRLFLGMAEEYGKLTGNSLQVNTAYRSFAEQDALYKSLGPGKAAKPGSSLHEFGLALDVNSEDLNKLDKLGLLRKYGFTRPLGSEPWHIEPAGIFDNAVRQKAKTDHNFATQFIESGVGRGGGGLGSRGRSGELRRDDSYAKMLFNASSKLINNEEATQAPTGAAKAAKEMTQASGSTPSPSLAGASSMQTVSAAGMSEVETKEGKIPSSVGSSNASKSSFNTSVKAANDSTMELGASAQGKGAKGSYTSLPESGGKGWKNNEALILAAAKMVGIDPALGGAIAAKESSLNPGAQGVNGAAGNSVAQGLYQFMPGTWAEMVRKHGAKYGISASTSPLDARANALLGMEYIKTNLNKGDGSAHDAYLGHLLGTAGLSSFKRLKDNDVVADSFKGAAANNPNVFYTKGVPATKQQLIENVNASLSKNLSDFKIPLSLKTVSAPMAESANSLAGESSSSPAPSPLVAASTGNASDTSSFKAPAPKQEEQKQTTAPLMEMGGNAPVSSLRSRSPVLENTNNGIGKLEKISVDALGEHKRTNAILLEIKDMLARSFEASSAPSSAAAPPSAAPPAPKALPKSAPSELPNSYVQRRRA